MILLVLLLLLIILSHAVGYIVQIVAISYNYYHVSLTILFTN